MKRKYKYGAIKSPKDLRDYRLSEVSMAVHLPEEFEVPHSSIQDQGEVGSCVAFAITSVLETDPEERLSTNWIYGYRPLGYWQKEGMEVADGLKTINKVGVIEYENCPGNYEMPQAKKIIHGNLDNYIALATANSRYAYARLRGKNEIKKAIYTNNAPVIVCIRVGINGINCDENGIITIPEKYDWGEHAIIIYGWNKNGFLIQNSWGEEWGNKGIAIMPINYPITESWIITDKTGIVSKPNMYKQRSFLMKIKNFIQNLF